MHEGDGAAGGTRGFCVRKAFKQRGKFAQRLVHFVAWSAGHDHYAHFFRGNWCDVCLGTLAPVYLRAIGPRIDSIATAKCETAVFLAVCVETAPAPDARAAAVRADDPTSTEHGIGGCRGA